MPGWAAPILIGAGAVGLLAGWLWNSRSIDTMRLLRMAAFALGFLGLGQWAMQLHQGGSLAELVQLHPGAIEAWTGRVLQPGQLSASGREWTIVEATRIRVSGQWEEASSRVRVSRDTIGGQIFQTGDVLAFQSDLKLVPDHEKRTGPPYNANLRRKGLFLKTFVAADQSVQVLKHSGPYHPYTIAASLASRTTATLHRYLGNGQEAALAAALTVGDKQDIDGETRQAYATSGTLHILAVSGMHVGLLYELFLVIGLMQPLWVQGSRRRNISLIVIVLLWVFAFVTGLQASIVRAVIMFCLVEWGRLQGRYGRPMDMLALAALLMLAIDPFQLYDLGFQLSFAAMAGIFLLYRPLVGLLNLKHIVPKYIWQATCLTLAAQVGTTPLALYHFHQFPTYFLPVNVPGVWLSGLALYGCLVVLGLSWWPWAASCLAWPVKGLLWLTNALMHWVAALPYALVEDLYPGGIMCLWMGIAVLMVLLWVAKPQRALRLWMAAGALAGMGLLASWRMADSSARNGIVLLEQSGGIAALAVRGGVLFHDADSVSLAPLLEAYSLTTDTGEALPLAEYGRLGSVVLPKIERPAGHIARVGVLVLAGRQMFHLSDWVYAAHPIRIVVSGHWKLKTRERYREQALRGHCTIEFLDEEGAVFVEEERERWLRRRMP